MPSIPDPVPLEPSSVPIRNSGLSLDLWAVLLSLAVALLVRFGLLKAVPW